LVREGDLLLKTQDDFKETNRNALTSDELKVKIKMCVLLNSEHSHLKQLLSVLSINYR
jgi:hypothetical protein